MTTCTRCQTTGFINLEQIDESTIDDIESNDCILKWIADNDDHDVQVCDCCGDGEYWYGEPGSHYSNDDPVGNSGPYAYNGGLCECH